MKLVDYIVENNSTTENLKIKILKVIKEIEEDFFETEKKTEKEK